MGAASSKGALGGAHKPNRDRDIGQLVAATHNGYNRHVQKDGTAWPAGNITDPVSADWTDAYGISAHEAGCAIGARREDDALVKAGFAKTQVPRSSCRLPLMGRV